MSYAQGGNCLKSLFCTQTSLVAIFPLYGDTHMADEKPKTPSGTPTKKVTDNVSTGVTKPPPGSGSLIPPRRVTEDKQPKK